MSDTASEQPPDESSIRIDSEARHYERHRSRQDWLTFAPERPETPADADFAVLRNIAERSWGPQASARSVWPEEPQEVITYVRAGGLLRMDSPDDAHAMQAGEFERETVVPGSPCVEANPSKTHYSVSFRISLRLRETNREPARHRKLFSEPDRKGRILLVASPDGADGSLPLIRDVRVYSSLLYPGRQVTHEIEPERAVWVHIVHGAVSLGSMVLRKGDGVGVRAGVVSVTAREHSELLLIDLAR